MSLYSILIISSAIIPLVLSFDKKVGFYRFWPLLFPSIIITAIPFIIIDIFFTGRGIWGFNPLYHSGIIIASLPLEEWLFFLVIPYSSIFIHYVLQAYFPDTVLPDSIARILSGILIILLLLVVILNINKAYTSVYFTLAAILMATGLFKKNQLLNRFFLSYSVIVVPFLIINGILTGSFISEEVVWYNRDEITGLRILTVPVEDFAYGFSLIFINLLLMDYFGRLFRRTNVN